MADVQAAVNAQLVGELLAAQERCPPDSVPAIFEQLDTDKNGSLDASEFRAFAMGRFNLTGENADKIFAKFDKNHDSTLDLKEFTEIITSINNATMVFEVAETQKDIHDIQCITYAAAFIYSCCLCTACTSCCIGPAWAQCYASDLQTRQIDHTLRLNAHITNELLAGAPAAEIARA